MMIKLPRIRLITYRRTLKVFDGVLVDKESVDPMSDEQLSSTIDWCNNASFIVGWTLLHNGQILEQGGTHEVQETD